MSKKKKGAEQKRRRLAAEEVRARTSRAFSAYGRPLEIVLSLKYLGRVILAANDDWSAVIRNLTKARTVWRRMLRIMSREGASPRVSGFFFKAVVQSVLLFGAETWVVTPHMGRVLGGFQDQVARWLTLGYHSGGCTEGGSTPRRRRRERRRVLRLWRRTFGEVRIQSRSILQRGQL